MVLALCMLQHWTILKLQSGRDFVLETAIYKVQRGITQKVSTQELWFLCSACRLMLVYICMKFHEGILNVFCVTERTQPYRKIYYFQFQRAITQKICNPVISLSARCLMSLYICVKFQENISNVFWVTEWTQFCDRDFIWPGQKQYVSQPYGRHNDDLWLMLTVTYFAARSNSSLMLCLNSRFS